MHELVGEKGVLTLLLDDARKPDRIGGRLILVSYWEVHLMVIRCFESLVSISDTKDSLTEALELPYLEVCAQVFLKQLYVEKHPEQEELLYCKVCYMCVQIIILSSCSILLRLFIQSNWGTMVQESCFYIKLQTCSIYFAKTIFT
jgi:hypothetical protein